MKKINTKVWLWIIVALSANNYLVQAQEKSSNDSLLSNYISIGYNVVNDNEPITNEQDYQNRKRDDHGLTYSIAMFAEAKLKLFKNTNTTIRFENYYGLFSRDMGTLSKIKKGDESYDYFSYILSEHPDWTDILLYDQVAVTKISNAISITNQHKNLLYTVAFKSIKIDSDANQKGTDTQHWLHKALNARNYYHTPFVDSSIFKGAEFNYFSLGLGVGYLHKIKIKEKLSINILPKIGCNYNTINKYTIVPFSPYANLMLTLDYGKNFGLAKRFSLAYNFYYEPNERLQYYSDPGTRGYQSIGLDIKFSGLRHKNVSECKSWYLLYTFSPVSIYFPIGKYTDSIINYRPKANNKASLIGVCNFSVAFHFK